MVGRLLLWVPGIALLLVAGFLLLLHQTGVGPQAAARLPAVESKIEAIENEPTFSYVTLTMSDERAYYFDKALFENPIQREGTMFDIERAREAGWPVRLRLCPEPWLRINRVYDTDGAICGLTTERPGEGWKVLIDARETLRTLSDHRSRYPYLAGVAILFALLLFRNLLRSRAR